MKKMLSSERGGKVQSDEGEKKKKAAQYVRIRYISPSQTTIPMKEVKSGVQTNTKHELVLVASVRSRQKSRWREWCREGRPDLLRDGPVQVLVTRWNFEASSSDSC